MGYPEAPRRTNALAVVSLVGGIASYLGFLCVGALVGIICGHLARDQIRRSGEDGNGLALAGIILGYSHLALTLLAVVVWLVFFGGLLALGLVTGARH